MTPIWRQVDAGAEYGIDLDYIKRTTDCCGCHPDCHDPTVGCMACLCKCQEGTSTNSKQHVYLVELPLLLGIQGTILEQLMERHRILPRGAGEERHIRPQQFRRLLKLILVTYGLQQVPLHHSKAAHNHRRKRKRQRKQVAPGDDAV